VAHDETGLAGSDHKHIRGFCHHDTEVWSPRAGWPVTLCPLGRSRDVEAEHHPALGVFGDVAVRHPQPGIGDVQQDVHRFPRPQEHGVLPDEVLLGLLVPCEDEEAASPWMWSG
jgi:hypothetical protein